MSANPKALTSAERLPANQQVVVGKDILELLTAAMYVDPLCIYREYIQNAADAIEDAVDSGVLKRPSDGEIRIRVDPSQRVVSIVDNGTGIPRDDFVNRLTSIGASEKRAKVRRGFRGVGRLSGLAYCQYLVFRSRSAASEPVSELRWDVRRMRNVLRDPEFSGRLKGAVLETISLKTDTSTADGPHFFEVRLEGVVRLKNDVLLDESAIRHYLAQVAPVPFAAEFERGRQIEAALSENKVQAPCFRIVLGDADEQVVRIHADKLPARSGATDSYSEIEFVSFEDVDGAVGAIGWVLHHSYLGALPPSVGVAGLRLRKHNVQVGGADLVAPLFAEPRFNAWVVGEIHVLDPRIIPNGRRDDFEPNVHYSKLQANLSALARGLGRRCRQVSAERTRSARVLEPVESTLRSARLLGKLKISAAMRQAATKLIEREIAVLEKRMGATHAGSVNRLRKELTRLQSKSKCSSKATARDAVLTAVLEAAVELFGLEKGVRLLHRAIDR